MNSCVLGLRHYLKILWSIVVPVTVDVVNDLTG